MSDKKIWLYAGDKLIGEIKDAPIGDTTSKSDGWDEYMEQHRREAIDRQVKAIADRFKILPLKIGILTKMPRKKKKAFKRAIKQFIKIINELK